MKISLRWLFDHIVQDVASVDVAQLVSLFNRRTAEIEHFYAVHLPIERFFAVQVVHLDEHSTETFCPELSKKITLPARTDAALAAWYLVTQEDTQYRFVALADFGSTKDGLLTNVDIDQTTAQGSWRSLVQADDYILEVDNKSVNHRPDLWGHYGLAREIAAHLGLTLKPLADVLAQLPTIHQEQSMSASAHSSVSVQLEDPHSCSRLAVLRCNGIIQKPSNLAVAFRLALVESRPINAVVDVTNYVMFDISQPMHVFDEAGFATNTMTARKARQDETLTLLDERQIALSSADTVITDGKVPVSLAGVMGGKQASFSPSTTNIILESAALHASDVRKSAQRYKTVSEASMRFSKTLDPMQTDLAIRRFVFLAQQQQLLAPLTESMIVVGKDVMPLRMFVAHARIERILGVHMQPERVIALLHSIEFGVTYHDGMYDITVPTFRISKDIKIEEDIIEEIGRLYGYEHIALELPTRAMKPFDLFKEDREFQIKNYCAYGMLMREIREYAFYDESFLQKLSWQPTDAVAIKNPLSENWKVLVTSLIPHLLKNIHANEASHTTIRFFEQNAVWKADSVDASSEHQMLAGVMYEKNISFYDGKAALERLFTLLGMSVTWKSIAPDESKPWFSWYKTAGLYVGDHLIGRAGMLDQSFIAPVVTGSVFAFEIMMEHLLVKPAHVTFASWSKYQEVTHDVSVLVDESVKAADLVALVQGANTHIIAVAVIDCFKKDDWVEKKALTIRYTMVDQHATMTQQDLELVTKNVETCLTNSGATLRI